MDSITVHVENSKFSLGISLPNPSYNTKCFPQYPLSSRKWNEKIHTPDSRHGWKSVEDENSEIPQKYNNPESQDIRTTVEKDTKERYQGIYYF